MENAVGRGRIGVFEGATPGRPGFARYNLGDAEGLVGTDETFAEIVENPRWRDAARSGHPELSGDPREGLLRELADNGIHHSPGDIVRMARNGEGDIVFLETGNSRAGLTRILEAHGAEFEAAGVAREDVPDLIAKAVTEGTPVGIQGRALGRPVYEVEFGGTIRRVAVTTDTNGSIVGANLQPPK